MTKQLPVRGWKTSPRQSFEATSKAPFLVDVGCDCSVSSVDLSRNEHECCKEMRLLQLQGDALSASQVAAALTAQVEGEDDESSCYASQAALRDCGTRCFSQTGHTRRGCTSQVHVRNVMGASPRTFTASTLVLHRRLGQWGRDAQDEDERCLRAARAAFSACVRREKRSCKQMPIAQAATWLMRGDGGRKLRCHYGWGQH